MSLVKMFKLPKKKKRYEMSIISPSHELSGHWLHLLWQNLWRLLLLKKWVFFLPAPTFFLSHVSLLPTCPFPLHPAPTHSLGNILPLLKSMGICCGLQKARISTLFLLLIFPVNLLYLFLLSVCSHSHLSHLKTTSSLSLCHCFSCYWVAHHGCDCGLG